MGFRGNSRDESEREAVSMPTYTQAELDEFGKFLDKFRQEKQSRNPLTNVMETIHPIAFEDAAVAFGAMKKTMIGGVAHYSVLLNITEYDAYGFIRRYESPCKWDIFQNKYDQWNDLQRRRKFGEEKRLEHYGEIADSLAHQKQAPKVDTPEPPNEGLKF